MYEIRDPRAKLGRGGDTKLAYISREEANILRLMGGSGTINPATGLREYKNLGGAALGFLGTMSNDARLARGEITQQQYQATKDKNYRDWEESEAARVKKKSKKFWNRGPIKALLRIGAAVVGSSIGGPLGAGLAHGAMGKITGRKGKFWKDVLVGGGAAYGAGHLAGAAGFANAGMMLKGGAGMGSLMGSGTILANGVGSLGSAMGFGGAGAAAGSPVVGANGLTLAHAGGSSIGMPTGVGSMMGAEGAAAGSGGLMGALGGGGMSNALMGASMLSSMAKGRPAQQPGQEQEMPQEQQQYAAMPALNQQGGTNYGRINRSYIPYPPNYQPGISPEHNAFGYFNDRGQEVDLMGRPIGNQRRA